MDRTTSLPIIIPTSEALKMEDYAAYKAGKGLYVYLSPILLILGLLGNILSFLVMSKRAKKPPPTYLYLSALAVADVFALIIPCVRGWLTYMVNVDLMLLMGCSWYFIVYFSACNISVYIICSVTVDRFIHTFFPLSARRWCTLKSAVAGLVSISIVMIVINFHYPWTMIRVSEYANVNDTSPSGYSCATVPGYEKWMSVIWPYLDLAIYSFLPFILLMTCNLLIIYRLAMQSRKMKALQNRPKAVGNETEKSSSKSNKTTIMLVLLSFMLLLTTSPIVVLHIAETYWDRSHPSQAALHTLATAICEHLMYLNNCLNFVLYLLSAKKFRDELIQTVWKRGVRQVNPSMENTVNSNG